MLGKNEKNSTFNKKQPKNPYFRETRVLLARFGRHNSLAFCVCLKDRFRAGVRLAEQPASPAGKPADREQFQAQYNRLSEKDHSAECDRSRR